RLPLASTRPARTPLGVYVALESVASHSSRARTRHPPCGPVRLQALLRSVMPVHQVDGDSPCRRSYPGVRRAAVLARATPGRTVPFGTSLQHGGSTASGALAPTIAG